MEDLSKYHSPLLERCDVEIEELSGMELQDYELNGFLKGKKVLNEKELELLRRDIDDIYSYPTAKDLFYFYEKSDNNGFIVFQASGGWRVSKNIHDLLWNRTLSKLVKQLLGGNLRLWNDQIFYKPPFNGGTVAWHQDYSYWVKRSQPFAHITCWIALDDVTLENGCVEYIPGSHKWGLFPGVKLYQKFSELEGFFNDEQQKLFVNPVPMLLKAGECSFHHPMVIHGSGRNLSNSYRRGIVINIFRDGVISKMTMKDKDENGFPYIPANNKLEGQFFPLIFNC